MSVKAVITIAIAGRPTAALVNAIRKRKGVRAKIAWLLELDPSEPPVIRHSTTHEYWLMTNHVKNVLEHAFFSAPVFSTEAMDVFMMSDMISYDQLIHRCKTIRIPRELIPAFSHIREAVKLREKLPEIGIFTFLQPIGLTSDDAQYDDAAAWGRIINARNRTRRVKPGA